MRPDKMRLEAHASLHRFVDEHRVPSLELLAELIKVPSDNPPGDCRPHAFRAAQLFRSLGFEVEEHPVPEDLARSVGMISATNLVIRHRFGPGPTIALNAHGDVVAPGGGWTFDPYGAEVKDGWIYGRAATASKSDFATYGYALLALRSLSERLGGTVEIHLTYDEEAGGEIGPKRLLLQGITRPDFAICAGFTYLVVTAHNGCLHLEIEINGKSSHAARPELGHDAMEAANHMLTALFAERRRLAGIRSTVEGIRHPTLVVGLINGGINTNVLPDQVTMRIDRRILPQEDGKQVTSDLIQLVRDSVKSLPGIRCETRIVMLAEPLTPLPRQDQLVAAIKRNADVVLGEEIPAIGAPIYTDARHYCAAGVPTVLYGAGPKDPSDANAHGPDERLKISDLYSATEITARACYDLLTGST